MRTKLIFLGTGNARVRNLYNTCFIIDHDGEMLLVDTGGGNRILKQLDLAGVSVLDLEGVFITHEHMDHLMGLFWLFNELRLKDKAGDFKKKLKVYGSPYMIEHIKEAAATILEDRIDDVNKLIEYVPVHDRENVYIIGLEFTFSSIPSARVEQFGFTVRLDSGEILTFLGDDTGDSSHLESLPKTDVLIHQAMCLEKDRKKHKPHKHNHTTAREAAKIGERLGAGRIFLVHTEDKTGKKRKELYTEEAKEVFSGEVNVPEDLEEIILNN